MVFIFFWDKSIKIQFILNIYFLKKKKKVINIFQLKTANILLGQIIKKIKVWKKHEVKKKNEAQGYDIYSKNTGLEQSVIFIHHVFSLNHSLYSRTKAGVNVRLIDGRCHYVRSLNWNNTMIITVYHHKLVESDHQKFPRTCFCCSNSNTDIPFTWTDFSSTVSFSFWFVQALRSTSQGDVLSFTSPPDLSGTLRCRIPIISPRDTSSISLL